MRHSWLLLVVLFAAACGSSGGDVSTTSVGSSFSSPEESARYLFEQLAVGEFSNVTDVVDAERLAVLTSIESADAQLFLSDEAIDERTSINFWSQFVAALPQFDGSGTDVDVTVERQFAIEGDRFATATVRVDGMSIPGQFVLRLTNEEWKLDAVASFGGPFISPIRSWLRTIPSDQVDEVRAKMITYRTSFLALVETQDMEDETGIILTSTVSELLAELGP